MYVCISIFVRMHVFIYICMYACMHVCVRLYICTYVCMSKYTHVHNYVMSIITHTAAECSPEVCVLYSTYSAHAFHPLPTPNQTGHTFWGMEWLRLVGSLKL